MKHTTTQLALAALLAAPAHLEAAVTLFADNFNRANNTNLNASATGKSGSLGALNWVEVVSGGNFGVVANELKGGDSAAGGGWVMSYVDHNFTDASILTGGGFSVSIDMLAYATNGATRHMGIAVGMSQAEAAGWNTNNPANMTFVDLYAGYRGNQTAIQTFESGVADINNTGAGGPATLPKTMVVDFTLSSFAAGSMVNYTVSFGDISMGSGSFPWSGTNENYIGVYTNLSSEQAIMDNFAVISAIPEPSAALLGGLGALLLFRRRR